MKKPEEIKKGLECYFNLDECNKHLHCGECPNNVYTFIEMDDDVPIQDALALIQHLESKLNQAVEDIRLLAQMEFACPVCAYYNHGEGAKGECIKCLTGDGFRWRGEKDDGRVNDDHHRTE